jgi:5-methylcytosine-specific restriction endonuclease McrA
MRQDIKNNLEKILNGEIKISYVPAFRINIKKSNLLGVYKCNECNIKDKWNNKDLLLELDHIDGNKNNNIRSNLRWLCPNCHSQTSTFRSKNNKYNKKIVNEDDILESIKKGGNISDILRRVNLKPKGDNYNRVHKICNKYNIKI